jgi:Transposase IS66 family
MSPLRREVERLWAAGSRSGVPKTAGTCQDMLKRREALWTFVQVAGVEPTNNAAERSIRPGVLWRKGSCGTQSAAGSRFVESMMTVVSTLKQQQRNVLADLTMACEAALRGEAAPSLLPAHAQKAQAAACLLFPLPERLRVSSPMAVTTTWRTAATMPASRLLLPPSIRLALLHVATGVTGGMPLCKRSSLDG